MTLVRRRSSAPRPPSDNAAATHRRRRGPSSDECPCRPRRNAWRMRASGRSCPMNVLVTIKPCAVASPSHGCR
jgi:hypothetical protein